MVPSHIATAALVALAGGCASSAAYIPEENATAILNGRTAAHYELPSDEVPELVLRVASPGISKLERADGKDVRTVYVRYSLQSNGDRPISFDVREQRIQFPDGTQVGPIHAHVAAARLPVVQVPPASSRTIDLFFPIPERFVKAKKMPTFDAAWRVTVDGEKFTQLTPFERVAIDPMVARQMWANSVNTGVWGYYDPFWAPFGSGFYGTPRWGW